MKYVLWSSNFGGKNTFINGGLGLYRDYGSGLGYVIRGLYSSTAHIWLWAGSC